uniref:Phosphatidylinositol binding clathrin assembly protein a n=1 Tax=Amphilophus citrinellus TaxID=61819 RepID=A0A3Q0T3Q7_AMPCI
MSGQSITDRITAAQHSVTGSAISKTVCKATTHEIMGPKKKHLDYLIQCTNEMNVNIPQLADTLFERTTNTSWVVVFKSLTTTHHLMVYGNERFIQYLASRNTLFNLSNFLDKSGLQGYDMSTFIRRYSRYLNEKAMAYRQVAFDFTKVKRGSDGVMRTMNTEKLLKTIPIVQNQMDVLLDFNVNANELTNGVINAAFMLLFKDAIRLFAAYNEGIINLLGKNKFLCHGPVILQFRLLVFLTLLCIIIEGATSDKGQHPSDSLVLLLDALEQHLASLEGKKVKDSTAASRASTLSSAVSSLANTGISFSKVDEREKQAALEEEQARLKALKEQRLKELQKNPTAVTTDSSPVSLGGTINSAPVTDLFSTPSSTFLFSSAGFTASPTPQQPQNLRGLNVDFDSVFGNNTNANNLDSTGGILKPTVAASTNQSVTLNSQQPHKLVSNDLDSSLANLVGNLGIGNGTAKNDLHWSQPGEKKLTGGTNWHPKTAPSTTWNPATMNSFTRHLLFLSHQPPQMGSMMITQPTMMYTQPVMRPPNPFGPSPGAQMQFM